MRCFWWRQHFRNILSSEPLFFICFKLPSCWFHCSHLFFQNLSFKRDTKFFSMVLHTWTNISISNWQFLIPCYHQNSKGNVKHILFQQRKDKMNCLCLSSRWTRKRITFTFCFSILERLNTVVKRKINYFKRWKENC